MTAPNPARSAELAEVSRPKPASEDGECVAELSSTNTGQSSRRSQEAKQEIIVGKSVQHYLLSGQNIKN